jgi:hypothetical protein
MDLVDEGIRFPHIAETMYEQAVEAFVLLNDADKVPAEVSSKQPRFNERRMRFVESAAVAAIAYAAALEAQIVLVGTSLYGRVRAQMKLDGVKGDDAGELTKLFLAKGKKNLENLPLAKGADVMTAPADRLHDFGRKLVTIVLRDTDAWPTDSHEKVAELRNRLVHRTIEVQEFDPENTDTPTTIKMLEDWDPVRLHDRLIQARETFIRCWELMQKTHSEFAGREVEMCRELISKPKIGKLTGAYR